MTCRLYCNSNVNSGAPIHCYHRNSRPFETRPSERVGRLLHTRSLLWLVRVEAKLGVDLRLNLSSNCIPYYVHILKNNVILSGRSLYTTNHTLYESQNLIEIFVNKDPLTRGRLPFGRRFPFD